MLLCLIQAISCIIWDKLIKGNTRKKAMKSQEPEFVGSQLFGLPISKYDQNNSKNGHFKTSTKFIRQLLFTRFGQATRVFTTSASMKTYSDNKEASLSVTTRVNMSTNVHVSS